MSYHSRVTVLALDWSFPGLLCLSRMGLPGFAYHLLRWIGRRAAERIPAPARVREVLPCHPLDPVSVFGLQI